MVPEMSGQIYFLSIIKFRLSAKDSVIWTLGLLDYLPMSQNSHIYNGKYEDKVKNTSELMWKYKYSNFNLIKIEFSFSVLILFFANIQNSQFRTNIDTLKWFNLTWQNLDSAGLLIIRIQGFFHFSNA